MTQFKEPWFWIIDETPSLEQILSAVSDHYGIGVVEMCSARRRLGASDAKKVAAYLGRELTQLSTTTIGRKYRRDHSTICQHSKEISERMVTDDALRETVAALSAKIGGAHEATHS